MATETKVVDGVIASSNLTGATVANLDEGVASPGGDWATATADDTDVTLHVSFGTPTGNPNTGAGLQTVRIYARKSATGGGDPTVTVDIYESGSAFATAVINAVSITSESGQTITGTWDASGLASSDGSGVEAFVTVSRSSGSPSSRRSGDIDAVDWVVDYTGATTYNETGSGTTASGGTGDPPELVIALAGSGTAVSGGAATDAVSKNETGSGTAVSGGAATDTLVALEAGSGTAASGGAAVDGLVFNESGAGTAASGGAAVDGVSKNETGAGTAASSGAATDTLVALEAASGGATAAGTGDPPELVIGLTGAGTAASGGAATDAQTLLEAASGGASTAGTADPPELVIALTGSGTVASGGAAVDEHVSGGTTYNETGSGTAAGGGAATLLWVALETAAGGGVVSGAAIDALVALEAGSGTVTAGGAATVGPDLGAGPPLQSTARATGTLTARRGAASLEALEGKATGSLSARSEA